MAQKRSKDGGSKLSCEVVHFSLAKYTAEFRGGKCLSDSMRKGDLTTKLNWSCAFGHQFKGSPTLILLAGHWCPDCLPTPWNYDEEARKNPFFAQVWHPFHDKDDENYYDESILENIDW